MPDDQGGPRLRTLRTRALVERMREREYPCERQTGVMEEKDLFLFEESCLRRVLCGEAKDLTVNYACEGMRRVVRRRRVDQVSVGVFAKERELEFSFHDGDVEVEEIHRGAEVEGSLYVGMLVVEVDMEVKKSGFTVSPNTEDIVLVSTPHGGSKRTGVEGLLPRRHENVGEGPSKRVSHSYAAGL